MYTSGTLDSMQTLHGPLAAAPLKRLAAATLRTCRRRLVPCELPPLLVSRLHSTCLRLPPLTCPTVEFFIIRERSEVASCVPCKQAACEADFQNARCKSARFFQMLAAGACRSPGTPHPSASGASLARPPSQQVVQAAACPHSSLMQRRTGPEVTGQRSALCMCCHAARCHSATRQSAPTHTQGRTEGLDCPIPCMQGATPAALGEMRTGRIELRAPLAAGPRATGLVRVVGVACLPAGRSHDCHN